jgi:hypothetical protein
MQLRPVAMRFALACDRMIFFAGTEEVITEGSRFLDWLLGADEIVLSKDQGAWVSTAGRIQIALCGFSTCPTCAMPMGIRAKGGVPEEHYNYQSVSERTIGDWTKGCSFAQFSFAHDCWIDMLCH